MTNSSKLQIGFTVMEVLLLVAVLAVIAAIVVPNFIKARNNPCANACVNNLRQIDAAKQQWALEVGVTNGPKASDIQPYLGHGTSGTLPYCPVDPKRTFDSSYIINKMATSPQCRLTNVAPNHVILE